MNPVYSQNFIDAVFPSDQVAPNFLLDKNISMPEAETRAKALLQRTENKRYRFGTSRDQCLNIIFERAFQRDPQSFIDLVHQNRPPLYSNLRKITHIYLPKTISAVLGNPFFMLAFTLTALFYFCCGTVVVYRKVTELTITKLAPFVIDNVPQRALQMTHKVSLAIDWLSENRLQVLFCIWVGRGALAALPIPALQNAVRRISLWDLLVFQTQGLALFILDQCWRNILTMFSLCSTGSRFFREIALNASMERNLLYKAEAARIWRQIAKENSPYRVENGNLIQQNVA